MEILAYAFDGNTETIWHTEWSADNPSHPHLLDINLNQTYLVTKLAYLPRQSGVNGRIANYEIYVSTDGVDWKAAVANGTWVNSENEQFANLSPGFVAKYIRLKALSEVNGKNWASVAEISLYGMPYSSIIQPENANIFEVKMYPNPANNQGVNLEVKNALGLVDLAIFSIDGKRVYESRLLNPEKTWIPTNFLNTGIYIILVNDSQYRIINKLIVK